MTFIVRSSKRDRDRMDRMMTLDGYGILLMFFLHFFNYVSITSLSGGLRYILKIFELLVSLILTCNIWDTDLHTD